MPGSEGQVKDNSKFLYDTYCVQDTIPVAYIVNSFNFLKNSDKCIFTITILILKMSKLRGKEITSWSSYRLQLGRTRKRIHAGFWGKNPAFVLSAIKGDDRALGSEVINVF